MQTVPTYSRSHLSILPKITARGADLAEERSRLVDAAGGCLVYYESRQNNFKPIRLILEQGAICRTTTTISTGIQSLHLKATPAEK
jgi:hypothetical protein